MQPLSSRASWLIVLGLSLGPAVSNGLARFAYGLILPAMREDLGWDYTEAGWINTANAIGYLIGALLALRFVATQGLRRLFIGGMLLTTLALLGSGLTADFWLLSAFRVLAGVGGAPVFIAGGAMASTLFKADPTRNALAIAVYFGGGGLGMLVTGAVIPLALERSGVRAWPDMWLLLSVWGAIAIVPTMMAALAIPLSAASRVGASAGRLAIAPMLPALVGYLCFAVGYIVYLTFLVAWMRDAGASASLVALTWSVLGMAVMLSPFVWRGVLARAAGGGAAALTCAATGLGTLLPILVSGDVGFLLSAALFGGSFFMVPTSVTTFSRKNLPEAQWGRAVALFTAVFAVGQTIGPVAAGVIADATASLSIGLVAAGLILLAGSGIAALQARLR